MGIAAADIVHSTFISPLPDESIILFLVFDVLWSELSCMS
jgi:hypothetical protein